jgi:hypothetical protein
MLIRARPVFPLAKICFGVSYSRFAKLTITPKLGVASETRNLEFKLKLTREMLDNR